MSLRESASVHGREIKMHIRPDRHTAREEAVRSMPTSEREQILHISKAPALKRPGYGKVRRQESLERIDIEESIDAALPLPETLFFDPAVGE